VPLFPPQTPVAVWLDGKPLAAYVRAYVAGGRAYVPVFPVVTRVADRLWFEGDTLSIERRGVLVRVIAAPGAAPALEGTYVAAGAVLRALGVTVRYDPATRRLDVRAPEGGLVTSPAPFDPARASIAPRAVFTPAPPVTPRPVWTGPPLPRRTPLPLSSPRYARSARCNGG